MTKPRLIDRLLTICLCVILILAFWCLSVSFAYHNQTLATLSWTPPDFLNNWAPSK